ncbi:MAG: ATP-binding protein [Gemmataceae bacterium]
MLTAQRPPGIAMNELRLRYIGPVLLITCCLVALCAFTAISLLNQQETLSRSLRENVESRRAAVELEECLTDLIALENDRVESVSVMHDRARVLLVAVRAVADQPEEEELCNKIERNFADYLRHWQTMPQPNDPAHERMRQAATKLLETETLKPCQEFKLYNASRIEASAEHHELVLSRLAWGLAGVGGLGGVTGLVLGFGMARGLARSIRRLRVQIRDAAGKLGPAGPEIIFTEVGEFHGLHDEVEALSERIKQVVGALQQREREVLRAEQLAAVGQLAAGVAHEIRNPLTSIKLLVQTAQEAGGEALSAVDLRVIEDEVRRMERSLQTFLDFARPPHTERRRTEIRPMIQGVLELLKGRAERQRIVVRSDIPDLRAVIDSEQIRQVVVNLCLNAIDAMPNGGTLELAVRAKPLDRFEIEVSDTGPGIPDAVMARLFQPFVSTKDTGLGLGLVISKRIVDAHGGTILAWNRPEGGSRFTINLPIHTGETEDADIAGG